MVHRTRRHDYTSLKEKRKHPRKFKNINRIGFPQSVPEQADVRCQFNNDASSAYLVGRWAIINTQRMIFIKEAGFAIAFEQNKRSGGAMITIFPFPLFTAVGRVPLF